MENWQILIPVFVAFVVIGFCIYFLVSYRQPAKRLIKTIDSTTQKIRELEVESPARYKAALEVVFKDSHFAHAWKMFNDTLHDEKGFNDDGAQIIIKSRATASSEYFFSQSSLIDTHIKSEFFKHLAGILTGIGIIGTFAGLLVGLSQFDPSGDPASVQKSLGLLLGGVRDAFYASGFAILMAMVVTFSEKQLLRTCYASLENLTAALDGLFESGVGEEYLERLVASSQESATQAKILKDSLVNDLKEMLVNVMDANQQNNQAMATQISQSITDTLAEPLSQIAAGVGKVSGDQGEAVNGLLQDVLTVFMNKLETTFGGQMTGVGDMLTRSVSAMQEMQTGIAGLISEMKNTSEASSQALEQQMLSLLSDMQAKQQEMGLSMTQMLATIEKSVSSIGEKGKEANHEMSEQISNVLTGITSQIDQMLTGLDKSRQTQHEVSQIAQAQLEEKTQYFVESLDKQISALLEETKTAIATSRHHIESLNAVSTSSIKGMNEGAEKMRLAAERFTSAGNSLNSVTEGSANLLKEINQTSTALVNASSQLKTLLIDYQQSREAVSKSILTLEQLIKSAQNEAGMSTQMLQDMKSMTVALEKVRQETERYLGQVSSVLGKGFEDFSGAVERSLNKTLGVFDNTLEQAVKRLAAGVKDLGEVGEELAEMAQRNTRR